MGVGLGVNDVPIVGEPIAYGIGFIVLLLVTLTGSWAGSLVTVVHEGGHMIMSALNGRGHRGFELSDGGGGGTDVPDRSWGLGEIASLLIGYIMPPLVGLGGALLVAGGQAWSVLWVAIVLLLLAVVFSRNLLATLVTLIASGGVLAAALLGSPEVQAATAVGLVWWMLIGGVRSASITSLRYPSDAYWLARRTLVPAFVWKLLWIFIAVVALIVGGQLLLRPGYDVG